MNKGALWAVKFARVKEYLYAVVANTADMAVSRALEEMQKEQPGHMWERGDVVSVCRTVEVVLVAPLGRGAGK